MYYLRDLPREPDPLPSRKGKVSLTIQTLPQWRVPNDVTKDVHGGTYIFCEMYMLPKKYS